MFEEKKDFLFPPPDYSLKKNCRNSSTLFLKSDASMQPFVKNCTHSTSLDILIFMGLSDCNLIKHFKETIYVHLLIVT